MNQQPTLVDRSRILTFRACPRMRYYQYHHEGTGIVSSRLSIPLATGGHFHHGAEVLARGGSADEAVAQALSAYTADVEKTMCPGNVDPAAYAYTIEEQGALIEALVRVWALRGLPALLAEYEIVEVESEYTAPLTPDITLMARLDMLLRRRADGDLFVQSFKTTAGGDLETSLEDARIDMQGLTEPWIVGKTERHPLPSGVRMEWLTKGAWKEEERGSGLRFQDTHLIRPYMRQGVVGTEWAWKYYTACPGTPHVIQKADGKTWRCPGDSKTHGLGPSWTRVPVWKYMPIRQWIDMLASGAVQPEAGDALASVIYSPPPILRSERQMTRTIRQIAAQETEVKARLEALPEYYDPEVGLDMEFPQSLSICNHVFGARCQFYDFCHPGNARAVDLLERYGELGFKPREPHHAPEQQLVQLNG
jgi:PD-(D/E)XK nuclease superfamily protein